MKSDFIASSTKPWHDEDAHQSVPQGDRTTLGSFVTNLVSDAPSALIAFIDQKGFYRYVSRSFGDWFDLNRIDILGRHHTEVLSRIFGPQLDDDFLHELERSFSEKEVRFDGCLQSSSGTRFFKICYRPQKLVDQNRTGVLVLFIEVTNEKLSEQRARSSARRLALAIQASAIGIWELDIDTGQLSCNQECFTATGLPQSEHVLLTDFQERIHRDDRPDFLAKLAESIVTRGSFSGEYRIVGPENACRWISIKGHHIIEDSLTRILGVVSDVTKQKLAEIQLATQARRVHDILEKTTDAVLLLSPDWKIVFSNQLAAQILNLDEVRLKESIWDLLPLAKGTEFERCCARTMRERVPTSFEEYYPAPLSRWFEVHNYPIEEGLISFFRDITARRQSEETLRLQAKAIESVPVGITVVEYKEESDFPLVFVNPAFENLTGYNATELVGQNCRILQGPETDEVLRRSIRGAIQEGTSSRVVLKNYRKNGEPFFNELYISPVRDQSGRITHYVGVQNDITERVNSRQRLATLAQFDSLTGLPNRSLFMDRLNEALTLASRDGQRVGVGFLDLDNFKLINDTLGHFYGDRLLCQIAQRLLAAVRSSDTVARLSGDEFAFFCVGELNTTELNSLMDRVVKAAAMPIELAGEEVIPTLSAGVALFPDHGNDGAHLVRLSDQAMYAAKRAQKNSWRLYEPAIQLRTDASLSTAAGLRRAMERQEFQLNFQPRILAASGRIAAVEALLRWRHPKKGLLYPGQFIRVAEDTGLIVEIGKWVLNEALLTLVQWRDAGFDLIPVSVNVSALQIKDPGFSEFVEGAIKNEGLAPALLELELTESLLLEGDEDVKASLKKLKRIGVRLAIDDFGTGYSGLSYLSQFQVDTLKIDRSFTGRIEDNTTSAAICRSVLRLAREIGLNAVAEGVESRGQAELLKSWGCPEMQGHLFAHAVEAHNIISWLEPVQLETRS